MRRRNRVDSSDVAASSKMNTHTGSKVPSFVSPRAFVWKEESRQKLVTDVTARREREGGRNERGRGETLVSEVRKREREMGSSHGRTAGKRKGKGRGA